jgi:hypothetical protein
VRTPKSFLSKSALLGLAGLGVAGAIGLSPTAAFASDGAPAGAAAQKVASYNGALQPNGYYCGPAATRIALSAHGITPSFDDLATDLGTTPSGTNSINDITRVLNKNYGYERYRSVEISDQNASAEEVERLRTDAVTTINEGDAVVANIAGTVTDTIGERHSYEGGHYLTVTGYADGGRVMTITDPADRAGSNEYQLPIGELANWVGSRGYAV